MVFDAPRGLADETKQNEGKYAEHTIHNKHHLKAVQLAEDWHAGKGASVRKSQH